MSGQAGLFDVDDRLKRLSDLGDQLEAFAAAVDFEVFRPELDRVLAYSDGAKGGRPPFDPVMMFKVLVIQTANTLSDERTEYLINDRLSFMRFLGIGLSDRVPDARTIWLFREKLTRAGAIGPLFERFDATLRATGYIAMSGQIVDASLVAAPRQRNTQAEKDDIKAGRVPQEWKRKPAKLRHKDRDARWTVKFTKAQAARGRNRACGRSGDPGLRLSQSYLDRSPVRLDPQMAGHGCGRARGTATARWPARQQQHRCQRLGRYCLSIGGERGLHGQPRLCLARAPQEAPEPASVIGAAAAQQCQISHPLAYRARLCRAEGPDGSVHPHHRPAKSGDEDRPRQPRIQCQTAGLPPSCRLGVSERVQQRK
jgi:transposase